MSALGPRGVCPSPGGTVAVWLSCYQWGMAGCRASWGGSARPAWGCLAVLHPTCRHYSLLLPPGAPGTRRWERLRIRMCSPVRVGSGVGEAARRTPACSTGRQWPGGWGTAHTCVSGDWPTRAWAGAEAGGALCRLERPLGDRSFRNFAFFPPSAETTLEKINTSVFPILLSNGPPVAWPLCSVCCYRPVPSPCLLVVFFMTVFHKWFCVADRVIASPGTVFSFYLHKHLVISNSPFKSQPRAPFPVP